MRYDESTLEWKKKLKAIIEYRFLYSEQNQKEQIDYALITAVPIETEAVKRLSEKWDKIKFDNDINSYYIGEILNQTRKEKIVTVQCPDMGMVATTVTTMNVVHHFNPKYVIMVGIAAGIGEHNFGDIIVPREVWNYSSGKYKEHNGKCEFVPDPKVLSLDDKVLEIIREDHTQILAEI